nr:hypothetical protein [uncultured Dyadobacter sp.]
MIYVSDSLSIGTQHEQFNSSFLTLLRQIEPDITFYADKRHSDIIKPKVPGLTFENIELYSKRGGIKEFIRAYHQFRLTKKIIKDAEANGVTKLIILLIHPLAHYLLRTFLDTKINIFIVTHGELESLKDNKRFFNKIWGYFLKRSLLSQRLKIQYIILGESIYNNLVGVLPAFKTQKKAILDHPYPFHEIRRDYASNQAITFSSLGVATLPKNSQYIFSIADRMSEMVNTARYRFYICGMVYKNMEKYFNEWVIYNRNLNPLSRSEVDQILSVTDFALLYYDNTHYSMCSSGSFWDAINAEIPILYVQNDYIDYYSSLVGGIGHRFESPEQLNDYIATSGRENLFDAQYHQFIDNVRKLKYQHMSYSNLVKQLSETIL